MMMRNLIELLTPTQLSNIIPVIEQGLEFEQLKYPATKDPIALSRITDTCLLLSSLYVRQLDINRPGCDLTDSCS